MADWAAVSILNEQIAIADGDLHMNISYGAGRICDDIIDSESRKAACLDEMRVGCLGLLRWCWRGRVGRGHSLGAAVGLGWAAGVACPPPWHALPSSRAVGFVQEVLKQ